MPKRAHRKANSQRTPRRAALAAALLAAGLAPANPPAPAPDAPATAEAVSLENELALSLSRHLEATRLQYRVDCVLPPDILDFTTRASLDATGRVELEATIKPALDGRVELALVGPADLAFASGAKSLAVPISRSAQPRVEKAAMTVAADRPTAAVLRATVYGEDGVAWLWMDKVVEFNAAPPTSPDDPKALVPVVFERPDGGRFVQRMTREQARRYEGKALQIGYAAAPAPDAPKNEAERAASEEAAAAGESAPANAAKTEAGK